MIESMGSFYKYGRGKEKTKAATDCEYLNDSYGYR